MDWGGRTGTDSAPRHQHSYYMGQAAQLPLLIMSFETYGENVMVMRLTNLTRSQKFTPVQLAHTRACWPHILRLLLLPSSPINTWPSSAHHILIAKHTNTFISHNT
jgi:hypothetical protein